MTSSAIGTAAGAVTYATGARAVVGAATPLIARGANLVANGAKTATQKLLTFRWGRNSTTRTGAYNSSSNVSGNGLGKLEGREVRVSEKGLQLVENHLARFNKDGPILENELMLQRLRQSLANNRTVSGADASFYIHEATEATKMSRFGMSYNRAHDFALNKYQVSPFSIYHPDVIAQMNRIGPLRFNKSWESFWMDYNASVTNRGRPTP